MVTGEGLEKRGTQVTVAGHEGLEHHSHAILIV
jgi:hypothetical protein